MTSEQRHIEVVAALQPHANAGAVGARLARHGVTVTPLLAGLLVAGSAEAVRAAVDAAGEWLESVSEVPPKRVQ